MLSEYGPLDRTSSPSRLHGVVESAALENSAIFVGEVWRRFIVVRRWSLEGRTKVSKVLGVVSRGYLGEDILQVSGTPQYQLEGRVVSIIAKGWSTCR